MKERAGSAKLSHRKSVPAIKKKPAGTSWRTWHFLPMEAARLQTPQAGVGGGGICEAGGDAVTAESRSFLFSTGFSYAFFFFPSSSRMT